MLKKVLVALLVSTMVAGANPAVEEYQGKADEIVEAARITRDGWERLATFCTLFPHRLSGSQTLEDAIDWVVSEMEKDGFDRVATQEVMVPHWERKAERLTILKQEPQDEPVLGLGGSASTGPEGVEAELLVVRDFAELEDRAADVEGKIVVFNAPFTSYGETVDYRFYGPSRAASLGAVACLVRSVTPFSLATPHTGSMAYDEESLRIPAAALTVETADHFQRLQDRGESTKVKLVLESIEHPDALSRNVIAEIKGREFPDEVVLMGGHIDGWDVGQGAQDDAGGVFVCWEALRVLVDLGWQPRRTIRVVLWTNEENGLRGAQAYRDHYEDTLDDHVLAIESDYGTFQPAGYGFSGSDEALDIMKAVVALLTDSVGELEVMTPGFGADIKPLMSEGVPGAGLFHNDERYFWYHHSPADTLDKIDENDYRNCVATLATTVFVIADLPQRLPFGVPEAK